MASLENKESSGLTPDQKITRDQIRRSLANNSSPNAHHSSEEGHFRYLLLKGMPEKGMNRDEKEELHFRQLMKKRKR